MTIADLKRIVLSDNQTEDSPQMQQLLTRVRDKQFYWIGDHTGRYNNMNGKCCFSHIIGLPTKGGQEKGFFDYQYSIYKALFTPSYLNHRPPNPEEEERYRKLLIEAELKTTAKNENIKNTHDEILNQKTKELIYPFKVRHVAVLKASGLGITELVLRLIVWLCLRNNELKDSQIIIFTGPRLELAVSLINRLKDLFQPHGITFNDKETVLNLNGVRIEAFPSHHADSARGLPNVSLIFADECSFFPDREKDNIMDIMLRNVPKSNPYLIAVSTPQKPGDLMDQIMKEPYGTAPFKKIWLDYTCGLDRIYDIEEIDKVKNSGSFAREFCLKFAGLEGNVLSQTAIDRCISAGETLAKTAPLDDWSIPTKYVMSIDIGWGSSATAIMVSRFVNGRVQILYSREFQRPVFQDILNEIWRLKNKCKDNLQNIIMDAANTELYTVLCTEFKQNPSQQYLKEKQAWCKKVNSYLENYLFIVPIAFGAQGRNMLNHAQRMIEEEEEGSALVGIHKSFEDLITSCRSAYAIEDKLDKERTVHADTFDALRLNLQFYRWSNK